MTAEDLARDIQAWQDDQWHISCPDEPARSSVDLARHLIAAGWRQSIPPTPEQIKRGALAIYEHNGLPAEHTTSYELAQIALAAAHQQHPQETKP